MADLEIYKGETPSYTLTAVRTNLLLPPTDPGYESPIDMRNQKVTFTAKLRKDDTAAIVQKGTTAAGLTGITVSGANPGNVATIVFAKTDFDELTATAFLCYDVVYDDGTDVAVLEEGTLKVIQRVTP